MLAQLIVSGVAVGCVYALIALGMTILFRSTTVVNFCHGEFFMLGAFAVLVPLPTLGWSYGWCIVFSLGLLFVVGIGVARGLMRPLQLAPQLTLALMTRAFASPTSN